MSLPSTPEPSDPAGHESAAHESAAHAAKRSLRERYLDLPPGWRTRSLAVGAAVVVLGAGAVIAAHAEHGEHGGYVAGKGTGGEKRYSRDTGGHHAERSGRERGGKMNGRNAAGDTGGQQWLAPAPLPALPADAAVKKAVGAVPGGRADSLRVVAQQGSGSAWAVEVLGSDGVRHVVTIDGVNGTITSNTVTNGFGSARG